MQGPVPWMTDELAALRSDHLPDLQAELDQVGLDGSVAVQARQSREESRWLFYSLPISMIRLRALSVGLIFDWMRSRNS